MRRAEMKADAQVAALKELQDALREVEGRSESTAWKYGYLSVSVKTAISLLEQSCN
jgi:hypothetical protein